MPLYIVFHNVFFLIYSCTIGIVNGLKQNLCVDNVEIYFLSH